ncbi:DUF2938 domain-containing protein [Alteromonas sp. 1_MG-2023]|uniref:DUF2938 domain-containing protein n=1 Tax=Alteromonas sp. 1_MG-2023 TaxID=3062669 RepID=UPI0026E3B3D0|nr:DUF2938 domain-containing protein [Alteromonas sp. 1_MG-2023]MDO6569047.1 DUF2938 domain-containing protein [Alteromonas sp. 1_MG-2023]
MNVSMFISAVFIGLGATLVLDVWAELMKRTIKSPTTNWCFVGRWFSHMQQGEFKHTSIAAAEQRPFECAIGWIAHYVIGAVYGVLFLLLVSAAWLQQPTVLPALLFGIVTIIFPMFVMQPAFGMGIAAAKAPNPLAARFKTIVNHSIFGLGFYLSALLIQGI